MNCLFICRAQYENLGDLLINKLLVDELCKYGKVYIDSYNIPANFLEPLLDNDNVIDVYGEYGVTSKKGKLSQLQMAFFCKKKNIRIITDSPGPLLSTKISGVNVVSGKLRNLIYHAVGCRMLGIGKCFSSFISKKVPVNKIHADFYYVRSNESVTYLREQLGENKVKYIPDLCFLLKRNHQTVKKKNIAIFDIRLIKNADEKILQRCKTIIELLLQDGYKVILYYQVQRDYDTMMRLYKFIDNPNVEVRQNIVWYNDLDFYMGKKYVFSNRLHSLLIGVAFGAYPVCLYEESIETLKLKHVLHSSFGLDLPIIFSDSEMIDYHNLYEANIDKVNAKFIQNANNCSEIISEIVGGN